MEVCETQSNASFLLRYLRTRGPRRRGKYKPFHHYASREFAPRLAVPWDRYIAIPRDKGSFHLRYMTLFDQLVAFENLHIAYRDARSCKRYRSSILKFSYRLEENLLALRSELSDKTYQHGGYREFIVADSKKRTIRAAPFRDRVVHHAVCNIIEPILDKGFVYDSYACRKGRGTHMAVRRLEHFIKSLESGPARQESQLAGVVGGPERERERERRWWRRENLLLEVRYFKIL